MKIKLTPKRKKDLVTIRFFMPEFMQKIPISEDDLKAFFDYSERGLHKERTLHYHKTGTNLWDGFDALIEGKRWRGICIHEIYEPGVLDDSLPYPILLEEMPREVVDFLKKEMFKGADAELIERTYQQVEKKSSPHPKEKEEVG